MGGQQLLLILLGVLIVGVAIAIGIGIFTDNAAIHNREAVTNDVIHLGARTREYYRTPKNLGGGGNSYDGLSDIAQLTSQPLNMNGDYTLTNAGDKIIITGIGKERGYDGATPLRINMTVLPDTFYIDFSSGN